MLATVAMVAIAVVVTAVLLWASRGTWSTTVFAKDGRLDVGVPKAMFDGKPVDKQIGILDYDITRDRFLIAIEAEPRDDARITMVSDWQSDVAGTRTGQQ